MQDLWQPVKENSPRSEARFYFLTVGMAVLATALAVLVAVLPGNKIANLAIWLQIAVAVPVFTFTVGGDWLTSENKLRNQTWTILAIILTILVFVASVFGGIYINVLLAPIIVGAGQRKHNGRFIIYLSLSAGALLLVEQIVFIITDWNGAGSNNETAISTILALTGVGLSLATFVRNYRGEVEMYQQEAATKANEMEVAHEIQTSLMPPSEIETGSWSMAARSMPARDVGGDFYEYIPYLDKGIGGIAIGDVAGKGIPAALQMAVVRTVFRIEARRRIFPGETLMSVNMALQAERSFGMVTMLYAFVDPATCTLHVANAGHNFPIILNGQLEEVRLPGLPLGIDDSVEYEERRVKIAPGTSVIFYTDGVVEAMDASGEMYGYENFRDAIMRYQYLEPRDMVDKLFVEISNFTQAAPQSDDITVVVLQNRRVESELEHTNRDDEIQSMFASVNASENSGEEILHGFEEENANWI